MATQAGCISFSVNTTQTKLDLFLTTKKDLAGMLSQNQVRCSHISLCVTSSNNLACVHSKNCSSSQQELYDGAKAVPIKGTAFKGVRYAAVTANVSTSEHYMLAVINTGQKGNGNTTRASIFIKFGAYAANSPGKLLFFKVVIDGLTANMLEQSSSTITRPSPRLPSQYLHSEGLHDLRCANDVVISMC